MKASRLFISFIIVLLLNIPLQIQAQWDHKSFDFDSISRDYWVYVPQNYNPSVPASLVVTLHGMGDNDTNFRDIGFDLVADTANFIVLVPNAVPYNSSNILVQAVIGGSRTWNSGAGVDIPFVGSVFPNSEINDVGFLNQMVDVTISNYSIDPKRVYVCGFSKGGFMTQRMAIESNDRYAAFATAAGTFGTSLSNPNPGRAIPLAHFNGTLDEKVNWQSGLPLFQVYVDSMITFWVQNNNCDITPIHETLPDTQNDGYTVDHDVYMNGDDGTVVEVFKVNGAGHVWLGFNNDISYTIEMWKFFSRYTNETLSLNDETDNNEMKIYPNPASNLLNIELKDNNSEVVITDLSGKVMYTQKNADRKIQVDCSDFSNGIYLIHLSKNDNVVTQKLIINK